MQENRVQVGLLFRHPSHRNPTAQRVAGEQPEPEMNGKLPNLRKTRLRSVQRPRQDIQNKNDSFEFQK